MLKTRSCILDRGSTLLRTLHEVVDVPAYLVSLSQGHNGLRLPKALSSRERPSGRPFFDEGTPNIADADRI